LCEDYSGKLAQGKARIAAQLQFSFDFECFSGRPTTRAGHAGAFKLPMAEAKRFH
jgi:hypothetical protein